MDPVRFQTHPQDYKHWRLEVDGSAARVTMKVEAKHSLRKDYELKLNSYDLGVDIELADLLMRLRFEHPFESELSLRQRITRRCFRPVRTS